jgi:nitrate reductase beta subunit
MEWKVAFPLHPEYRTLPMVWYVPPLSPIKCCGQRGQDFRAQRDARRAQLAHSGEVPRQPADGGGEAPVVDALERMLAMRGYMRAKTVEGVMAEEIAREVGLTPAQIEEMYHVMAIANYEDRFVIPTGHREDAEDMYEERGGCGFSFGNGCSGGTSDANLFGAPARKKLQTPSEVF